MAWIALSCPQCSAPLPRVAIWRAVKCGSCGSLITRTESVLERDSFRQALKRASRDSVGADDVVCDGARYQLMQKLGSGEISHVHLARRVGSLPLLTTIKLSALPVAATIYAREAQVAMELQGLDGTGVGTYFSRLLPEVIAHGMTAEAGGRLALVLRHPCGYWGSLAALNERFATGIDPRHAVWIWLINAR